jgi:hypothetical protein
MPNDVKAAAVSFRMTQIMFPDTYRILGTCLQCTEYRLHAADSGYRVLARVGLQGTGYRLHAADSGYRVLARAGLQGTDYRVLTQGTGCWLE